jgi:EpsI family protein
MHKALTSIQPHKIIILIICFGLTSILIYRAPTSKAVKKEVPLAEALADIQGWSLIENAPLDPKIVKALELDDYANHSYSSGSDTVSLYIGYYLTTKKVGAAHSPLVCFPGQGWVLSKAQKKSLIVQRNNVHLMSMIVSRGEVRELVLYWFQAFDKTSPGTFLQKVYALLAKFLHAREDNAFVRVSAPIAGEDVEAAFLSGSDFIKSFYPVFLEYVKAG